MLLETVSNFSAARRPAQYRLHECLWYFLDGLHHADAPGVRTLCWPVRRWVDEVLPAFNEALSLCWKTTL